MKKFDALQFSFQECRKETAELQAWLAANMDLKESKDILPFFRSRPHLSAFCGSYNPDIARFDRISWKYDLFGDFACDLVVGDSHKHTFSFIEFEDASPQSLFVKQGKKATREWSPRLDHGYGQIIDWFYKLNDRRNSDECQSRFGKRVIDYVGILIVGRNQYMDDGKRLRFEWRREHVIVHSKRIHCITFDERAEDLIARLDRLALVPPSEENK